jgi:tetratricopeptide (TPR) repeat protein
MRSLLKAGLAAGFAAILFVSNASISPAQPASELDGLTKQVDQLQRAGKYSKAIPLAEKILTIRERQLGPDHSSVATALDSLARLLRLQGRYADAEPLQKRSLAIRQKEFGDNHPDVAEALNNLALIYSETRRDIDAESLHKQALEIREQVFGPDHPTVALSLNNLAIVYWKQHRYLDAEPLYKRAIAIRRKVLGRDHPDLAVSLNSLALLYFDEARYSEAEPLYLESLRIREKAHGLDHPAVGIALQNLAALYWKQERYLDAEPLYKRALAIKEQTLGPDHPSLANSLTNLAVLYHELGRRVDAASLHERALTIRERSLGPNHPDVAHSLYNLTTVYESERRYADAEGLFQRALAIKEKALGADHLEVAQVLFGLAGIYFAQARYADAERSDRRALDIRERTLGQNHPDVVQSLNLLARLSYIGHRYADALTIIRRTISQGSPAKNIAFPVLFISQAQGIIDAAQGLTDSYEVVQRTSSSAAANAISKLAARLAAGTSELAQLVRGDQDLVGEAERLDKDLVTFVSKPPAERSAAAEDQIRRRIEAVKLDRENLQRRLNAGFPDYVALSKPQPVSLQETQALLADDEALLVFDFDAKSYGWIITKNNADWTELKVSAKDLDGQVRALRVWLTDPRKRFDPEISFKIYQATFGAFADKIAAKQRLSIVTNGALTSLPPQLLVANDPSGKKLKELDWLIRSHAVTVLPSVASLKILRSGSQASSARKPMIAFADPVFSKAARAQAQQFAMRSLTSFYRGT